MTATLEAQKDLILVSWVGTTDLQRLKGWRESSNLPIEGALVNISKERHISHPQEAPGMNGPIRALTDSIPFKKVFVLCSKEYSSLKDYIIEWVGRGCKAEVIVIDTGIDDPTDYGQIYEYIKGFHEKYWFAKDADKYIFNVSPGTPSMQAITLFMVSTRFIGSHLYKTLKPEHVKKTRLPYEEVSLPFILPKELFANQNVSSSTAQAELKDKIIKTYALIPSVSILILGESGVGKSKFAKDIHFACNGLKDKFVTANCAELASGDGNMFRSALFGAKKGSYTGCDADVEGLFSLAEGGTLFLDEVAEIPYALQSVLLRAIQDKVIQRVGDKKTIKINNVRIIAATNKDLVKMVENHEFREDLYYRIAMCPVQLPSLREIAASSESQFTAIVNSTMKNISDTEIELSKYTSISAEAMRFIKQYQWPGNIRQLSHTLLLACLNAKYRCENQESLNREILVSDIRELINLRYVPIVNNANHQANEIDDFIPSDLDQYLEEQKLIFIKKALEKTHMNVSKASSMLGITYQKLDYFMKQNHLKD